MKARDVNLEHFTGSRLHPVKVLSEIMDPKWVPEVGGDC